MSDSLTDLVTDVVGGWDDVEVGYLLGRGSSGSVYRAKWNGKHVAVKVCHVSVDSVCCGSRQSVLCQKTGCTVSLYSDCLPLNPPTHVQSASEYRSPCLVSAP